MANLLNSKLGLFVQETDGMVETQFADEGGEPFVAGGLGESGSNAFLRQSRAVDERLTLKMRVKEQLFTLDEVAEIGEKVGVGTS